MYEEFFSFSGSPFRLAPDPKFFFGSKSHNKAMAYLHYGLRQAEGFIVITGEIGAGKSVLIGHLLDQLDRSNVLAANLATPNLAPEDLLSHILSAFRIEPSGTGKTAEIEAFEDFLFDQMNHGRRVLLIVDEAQNLPVRTLEELRVLSNLEYDGTPLFQVFLVGQPDFRETMSRADMEQLRQRVIASYHLEPMSREETEKYIEHRLAFVGWSGDPKFTRGAYDAIYAATGGVPRKIHKLCNRALLYCSVEKSHDADEAAIALVLSDMSAEQTGGRQGCDQGSDAKPKSPDIEPAAVPFEPAPVENITAQADAGAAVDPPAAASYAEPVFSASVFDRLRAKKMSATNSSRADEPSGPADADIARPPRSATLDDVASAILAASAGKREAAVEDDEEQGGDVDLAPKFAAADGWRKSVVGSINDTREELKRAHQSVGKLRRQLTEIDKRRRRRRVEIAASLDRAESLLAEFQNAWR